MKAIVLVGMMMVPGLAWAAGTDCRVLETDERYEVVCTGDPLSKNDQAPVDTAVKPVQGKHRPQPRSMDEERAMRMKLMKEQSPVLPGSEAGAEPAPIALPRGGNPDAK